MSVHPQFALCPTFTVRACVCVCARAHSCGCVFPPDRLSPLETLHPWAPESIPVLSKRRHCPHKTGLSSESGRFPARRCTDRLTAHVHLVLVVPVTSAVSVSWSVLPGS